MSVNGALAVARLVPIIRQLTWMDRVGRVLGTIGPARPGDRLQVSRTGGTGAIWRADSREVYYEGTDGLMAVAMTERGGALDVGTPQKLFTLHTQGYRTNQPNNVEVAANGQKFLVNTILGDSDNVPIEVTLNWTTGLKK